MANSYLQLRGLDAQLAVAKQTLQTYKESVDLFTLQFQYGQVSMMNVAQAQSQYEIGGGADPADRIADRADPEFAGGADRPRPGADRARQVGRTTCRCRKVPAGVPSQLLERRPDLLQAEQQLVAANAQIGAAKALYFPTISLTGAFGSASTDLSKLFSGPARVWSYAGSVVGPIFTFGAVSGQVAQAEAAQNAALLNYQLSIRNAFADVDNALVANQKLQEQLDAQVKLVAALQQYTDLARLQYDGGYTSYSHRAAGRAGAVPGRAEPGIDPRAGVRLVGEHLQGDGRRLGHAGRPFDRQHAGGAAGLGAAAAAVLGYDPLRWQLTPSSLHTLRMRSTMVEVVELLTPGWAVDTISCARLSPSTFTWMPPICRPSVNSTERRASSVRVTLTSVFLPSIDLTVSKTLAGATSTMTVATS